MIFVGAYWGRRQRTLEGVAASLAGWLTTLAALDPELLSGWSGRGLDAEELRSLRTIDDLQKLVAAGMHRYESTGDWITDLGWLFQLSNEHRMLFRCQEGSVTSAVPNSVQITIDERGDPLLTDFDWYRRLLSSIVECWSPDWAVAGPREMLRTQRLQAPRHSPLIGWLTFLSGDRMDARGVAFGEPSRIEQVGNGYLLTLGQVRSDVTDARVESARARLSALDALRPIAGLL